MRSSFSSSRLCARFLSVLTFPRHDERPDDIYVLLLFPLPAQCQTHLNKKKKKKRDGHGMNQGENDGEKVILGGILYFQFGTAPGGFLSLDETGCYTVASKHLSHIGE